MKEGKNSIFSLQDTNCLKGLAICLMLIHHLFWVRNGLFDDIQIGNLYLVNEIGKMAKVCVAIFVFLSGYGLMIQAERKGGVGSLRDFYFHRFKKLFLNYWFIWLVFVPISYFCFGMTFQNAYQTNIGWHLIADLLGLHSLLFRDVYCYNPTWWFYSCIIILYLFFPLMYRMIKRDAMILFLFALIISFLPIPFIEIIQFNIVAFLLGMWMASKYTPPTSIWAKWILLILILLYTVDRVINKYPLLVDCLITILIVQFFCEIKWPNSIIKIMAFLGKHSMNIFLFHTFIFGFWFQGLIYWSRNPIIIFITLLMVCIPISMFLEWAKRYTIYRCY